MPLSRRRFLASTALTAALATPGIGSARAEPTVVAGGADYRVLALRGYNRRFVARPRRFHVPDSAEAVRRAVARSVDEGLRLAVRSGGHCFEGFVDDPGNQVIVDLTRLRDIGWDAEHRAFSVGPGATMEDVYTGLARWNVTVPGGICKAVGAGGHIIGGGYGPLSRQLGLMADHLYGVEVATVAADGEVRLTTATADGPNQDLWWAHTGGGGGNFGVVTRFLMRSRDSDGAAPESALPRPPATVLTGRLDLPLTTEESFVRFMRNYLDFYHAHREPGNRFAGLYAPVQFRPRLTGAGEMLILESSGDPDAHNRIREFIDTVTAGVLPGAVVRPVVEASYADTVANTYYPGTDLPPRVKTKAAYLRQPYTEEQLRACYRNLAAPEFIGESALEFLPFGGAINAQAPDATAMPARDSFMKMLIHAAWRLPVDDERHIRVARRLYRELYDGTGGVPVPGERDGGSYINYPDPDLADPVHNTSGTAWSTLYYGANYPRLQQVKAQWDAGDVFRHALSIRPD
ncbi:FAD-binding protein [Nocardia sp. NPDC024068]|uniref:FAD-binding oxidoreductase n=1 Tax=Nocardia sp. NPDC024068 TaxID=3157197 RepID=UPI0034058170